MDSFYRFGDPIESNSSLASDVMATIYAGYVSEERKGAEVSISSYNNIPFKNQVNITQ